MGVMVFPKKVGHDKYLFEKEGERTSIIKNDP